MNKKYPFIIAILLVFSGIFSCEKSSEKYYAESSGPINLVSVFATQDMYKAIEPGLSDSLMFGKIFPGLYFPPEIMFATRQFEPDMMKRFKTTRLILDVQEGENTITIEKNKFAKPQGYIKVTGNSAQDIVAQLQAHQDSILQLYRWADRQFLLKNYKSDNNKDTKAVENLGASILVPKNFKLVENNDNFVWYRKDINNTVENIDERDGGIVAQESQDIQNMLLFKIPFTKDTLTKQELYFVMDSMTKIYTKGGKEPQQRFVKINNGKDSIKTILEDHIQVEMNPMLSDFYDFEKVNETTNTVTYDAQGYWSMTLSQMGGPFTSKIILDKKNNMLYIVDAVLFAPLNNGKSKKRDYITAMESLFTTFKIKE